MMMTQRDGPGHRIPNFYECTVCRKNVASANHYCQDCRTMFCDGCMVTERESIATCSECGMNLFATDEKTGALYCKHCADQGVTGARLVNVTREKSACPRCRSANTVVVEDLKASLKEQYKTIVIDCRNVLDDFQNFTNFMSLVKQKILKLRLESPVMVHEPSLDGELLAIMEESTAIERRVLNRVNNFFLFLRAKKPYFLSGKPWLAEDIAILDSYVDQLQSDFMNFLAQVSESFNQPLDVLCSLKDRVEYFLGIKETFLKFMNKSIVTLDRDEHPVFSCDDVGLESDQEELKGHGHVLLTTKHVKFIKSQGLVKKSDALLFSYPVGKLVSSELSGKVFKRVALHFQGSTIKFSMDKAKMQGMMNYVEQLVDFEKLNGKINPDIIQKIKAFDINSVFKIKAFIEQNINALLDVTGHQDRDQDARGYASPGIFATPDVFDAAPQPARQVDVPVLDDLHPFPRAAGAMQGGTPDPWSLDDLDQEPTGWSQGTAFPVARVAPVDPAISSGDPRMFHPAAPRSRAPVHAWETGAGQWHGHAPAPRPAFPGVPRMPPAPSMHDDGARASSFPGNDRWGGAPLPRAREAILAQTQESRYLVQQLQTCEQKQASIAETLKNLEGKFESGKVAPSVYFQTHQLFSEKYISISREMESIKSQLASMRGARDGW